ncbi:hypothetical protein PGT21_031766 [Puccinia graminis f. sp. tritici]|uniref:Uncharacterized protein n=1 Tax=Puccinia graminis f. sp. tritici TaxID=56615 RepID=A0A5B0RXN9_PUCGR|nr:hypothetical protein PGT21_031766 [Puccinia graminis f. sp. tritici]KAA1130721.1 hypothetical protein PGTUg99_005556 [Puccinia graminis f. sp. tritici]
MKKDLKELNEKLVAVPGFQPNSPIDRMTFVNQYFPHLSAKAAFKKFNFEERVILSSATIYRNEKYQELWNRLEVYELELTVELLPVGHSFFSLPMDEHVQNVQRKVSTNNHYRNLQSKLLQMRVKRRYLEMQVGDNGQARSISNLHSFAVIINLKPLSNTFRMSSKQEKSAFPTGKNDVPGTVENPTTKTASIICASENNEDFHSVIANQTTLTTRVCTEMKNDLKELKEKLVAVPVFQPNVLDKRVVLPSAKNDQNKAYQELLGDLEVHEAELTSKLLPAEHSMFLSMHQLAQRVERKISSTNTYQNLQANLLQMRIKRRQLELQVKNHASPRIACMFMPDGILEVNNEVSSSDTSGSSSLIFPKI